LGQIEINDDRLSPTPKPGKHGEPLHFPGSREEGQKASSIDGQSVAYIPQQETGQALTTTHKKPLPQTLSLEISPLAALRSSWAEMDPKLKHMLKMLAEMDPKLKVMLAALESERPGA
jgi:hypothetical protein